MSPTRPVNLLGIRVKTALNVGVRAVMAVVVWFAGACLAAGDAEFNMGGLRCVPVACKGDRITGSEGLIVGPRGERYAAEESGRGVIWRWKDGEATRFVTLPSLPLLGPSAGMLLGLAVVGEDLFVASAKYQGGSVIRIPIRAPARAKPFATHLGPIPNGLVSDGRSLFVLETIFSRLYKLRLDRPEGTSPAGDEIFPAPRPAPNGLALSPDGRTLFIVHTSFLFPGYLSAVDTVTMKECTAAIRFTGMGDGLVWWRGSLWACRQHEGQIVRIDPNHLDCQTTYILTGGQEHGGIRPASIVFYQDRAGHTAGAVTDVAEANTFNYFLRFFGLSLRWHHRVYRFSTASIL